MSEQDKQREERNVERFAAGVEPVWPPLRPRLRWWQRLPRLIGGGLGI